MKNLAEGLAGSFIWNYFDYKNRQIKMLHCWCSNWEWMWYISQGKNSNGVVWNLGDSWASFVYYCIWKL